MSNPKNLRLPRNCLSADARRAHRENVIARNESGTAEVPLDDASGLFFGFKKGIGLMRLGEAGCKKKHQIESIADFW